MKETNSDWTRTMRMLNHGRHRDTIISITTSSIECQPVNILGIINVTLHHVHPLFAPTRPKIQYRFALSHLEVSLAANRVRKLKQTLHRIQTRVHQYEYVCFHVEEFEFGSFSFFFIKTTLSCSFFFFFCSLVADEKFRMFREWERKCLN